MLRKKKMLFALVVILACIFLLESGEDSHAAETENADIRIIFTTDLHGMLTTTDYELDKEFNLGSLAKAYTLIEAARAERIEDNSFTFDVGDVLYDYTTENIFEMDPDAVQPIYESMKTIGYDAVVLGNHEFDYGYSYIMNQMEKSGLKDICVVSNLKDVKTGKTVFHKDMLITRQVKTQSGDTATVKIGVIGETIPILSKKRENYLGVLETEDIITNTKKQAQSLKARGADMIVVLAHTGFGTQNPTPMSQDVAYALTSIAEVDVVLCGHQHKVFPSKELESADFYMLPNVDKKTGLVNGKNLVMANDRGQSIGVVDLTLEISKEGKKITKRSSKVRMVKESTKANEKINDGFGEWKEIFTATSKNIVGNVAPGQSLNNFFGLAQDTNTIQIMNNAMIHFAIKYINSNGKKYKNHPVIAATRHNRYGQLSAKDYANIKGQISEANLSAIVPFNKYICLYEITGTQLREWLEWSASAYETTNKDTKWTDETMNSMMALTGVKPLISEEWQDEWSSVYIFDGIDYTINPSVEPRYNYDGDFVRQTSRISNITYNGVPITDDMKFILAAQSLAGTEIEAIKGIDGIVIRRGITKRLKVLIDYVTQICQVEDVMPSIDNNWSIVLPEGYKFLLKLTENVAFDKEKQNWIQTAISTVNQYTYYQIQYHADTTDIEAPNLVIASTNEAKTNQDVTIAVNATDSSGIKELKYIAGNYSATEFSWVKGSEIINNHIFTVSSNGIYTVYAEDNAGNKMVSKIRITNINREILQVPTVSSYTNRVSSIKGTAEPNADIYFITAGGTYESKVDNDGGFSCKIPNQLAGSTIKVYVKDMQGRRSEQVSIKVKRTGPNFPEVVTINNNDTKIIGNAHDSVKSLFAVVGDKVYVSTSGVEAYKKCEKYMSSKTIIKSKVSLDSEGKFSIVIPPLRSSTKVTVYAIDHIGRASKANTSKVEHVAPNAPTIYAVCNGENQVHGRIYSTELGNIYNVNVIVGGENYKATTDDNGYYSIPVDNLEVGQTVRVYATDTVENITRKSAVSAYAVKDVKKYVSQDSYKYVTMDMITDKTEAITGVCDDSSVTVILKIDDMVFEVNSDEDGNFEFPLLNVLRKGTKVSAVVRLEHGGIIEAAIGTVVLGEPYQPILMNPAIFNTTRHLSIACAEKGSVTVKVGSKKYTSKEYYYDEAIKSYMFDVKIENVNSGNKVSIYETNSAGNSTKLTLLVLQKAPNTPKAKKVDTNTKVIKGTVNLFLLASSNEEAIPPTVSNTKTKVFAKIGYKVYEATIKDDGTYKIKIPKQKVKTAIVIWAENAHGKGPKRVIKVMNGK